MVAQAIENFNGRLIDIGVRGDSRDRTIKPFRCDGHVYAESRNNSVTLSLEKDTCHFCVVDHQIVWPFQLAAT